MSRTRAQFVGAVQAIMRREYAVEAEEPIEGAPDVTPEQWVAWYAKKYDLVRREDWTLDRAVALIQEMGLDPPASEKDG